MAKSSFNYIFKLKLYHIILLCWIINSLFCLNIQKSYSKLRKLIRATGCFTASQELIDYYSYGDLSKIDLDEDIKNYFNKDSKYIKSLINIENNLVYRDIEELFYDEEKEGEIFDKEKDIKKNIKIYLSHF